MPPLQICNTSLANVFVVSNFLQCLDVHLPFSMHSEHLMPVMRLMVSDYYDFVREVRAVTSVSDHHHHHRHHHHHHHPMVAADHVKACSCSPSGLSFQAAAVKTSSGDKAHAHYIGMILDNA